MICSTLYLLLLLLLNGAEGAAAPKQDISADVNELRSAVVVNQLLLSQYSEAVKQLLNHTQSALSFFSRDVYCPPPYERVIDECFYLSSHSMTWEDARKFCQRAGGDLAVPDHVEALHAIVLPEGKSKMWVGGTDHTLEGTWQWLDGRNVTDWLEGEPTGSNGGKEEHCLNFLLNRHPPVNDEPCEHETHFICEIPPRQ